MTTPVGSQRRCSRTPTGSPLRQFDQANERHEEIERQTVYLRALRDSTKMQVETFLSGLLDHVGQLWADRAARPGAGGAPGRRPPNRTFS